MKHDPSLTDYIIRTEQAINANPPHLWPAYADDPVACWRYIARIFGHGLAVYPEEQVKDAVKSLYGRWFIRLEFHHKIPNINSLDFIGWMLEAMREAK